MEKYQTLFPRFWAVIIDALILLPLGLINLALENSTSSASLVIAGEIVINFVSISYVVLMLKFYGQTVGKMITKVKVLDISENALTFSQSVMRELPQISYLLILLILGKPTFLNDAPNNAFALNPGANIFYILLSVWGIADIFVFFLNDKRRALHDYIAGTVVVKTNAPPI